MKIVVNQRKYARNVVKEAVNQNKKSHAVGGVLFNNNKFTLNVNQVSEYPFEKINVFVIKPKFNFYLSIREATQPIKEKIKIRIIKNKKEINFFYKLFLQKIFTKNILLIKKQEIIFSLFFWKVKNIFCFAKLKPKKYFELQNHNNNFSYQSSLQLLKSFAAFIFIFSSFAFAANFLFLNSQKISENKTAAVSKNQFNNFSKFLIANSDGAALQVVQLTDNQENQQAIQAPNNIIADATH